PVSCGANGDAPKEDRGAEPMACTLLSPPPAAVTALVAGGRVRPVLPQVSSAAWTGRLPLRAPFGTAAGEGPPKSRAPTPDIRLPLTEAAAEAAGATKEEENSPTSAAAAACCRLLNSCCCCCSC
ncbi:unnamed protein product, partial [Ectocarpus sp. 13 AM-2016]